MQTLLCQLIILFFIFSIVGWMIEVTLNIFSIIVLSTAAL